MGAHRSFVRYAPYVRDDHTTLEALGLSEDERHSLGLWAPATADPSGLTDVYLRRSKRREDIATLRGHLRDIVRWTSANGLQVRHVWFEQLSASKVHVRRLEFESATQAILDGKSKTLTVWKTDRFDRRGMGQVGRMLDEFDRRRARLVCVIDGLDSSQPGMRTVFGIMAERAREEAKDISARVQIGQHSHKEAGRRGPGSPPFGLYSPPGSGLVEPHTTEYVPARRIADLMLEGKAALATAGIANAEGILTRQGNSWTAGAISRLVQSPLFAGIVPVRERKLDEHGNPLDYWNPYGEPLLDKSGQPVMCGVGVVTVAEWYRIRAGIKERTHPNRPAGKPAAKYLLTGFMRCGHCLGRMSHRAGSYRCAARHLRGEAVCIGVNTKADRVDRAVSRAWILYVSGLHPEDPVIETIARRWLALSDPETQAARAGIADALASAQTRLQRLQDDYYVHGRVSEERYEQLSGSLAETIEAMSTKLEALEGDTSAAGLLDLDALTDAWDAPQTTFEVRRMLLQCAIRSVTLLPAKRRGDMTPIEERIEIDWVTAGSRQ